MDMRRYSAFSCRRQGFCINGSTVFGWYCGNPTHHVPLVYFSTSLHVYIFSLLHERKNDLPLLIAVSSVKHRSRSAYF